MTAAIIIGILAAFFAGITALRNAADLKDRWLPSHSGNGLPPAELKSRIEVTSRRLVNFISDRQQQEVQALTGKPLTFANHQERFQEVIQYSTELQNAYARDIAPTVEEIKAELAKKGIVNEDLDNHRTYTTNSIGLRKIVATLDEIAQQLDKP